MRFDVPLFRGLGAQNRKVKSGVEAREAVLGEKRPMRVELPGESSARLKSYGSVGVRAAVNGNLRGVDGTLSPADENCRSDG